MPALSRGPHAHGPCMYTRMLPASHSLPPTVCTHIHPRDREEEEKGFGEGQPYHLAPSLPESSSDEFELEPDDAARLAGLGCGCANVRAHVSASSESTPRPRKARTLLPLAPAPAVAAGPHGLPSCVRA
jgi:hypothetical protein